MEQNELIDQHRAEDVAAGRDQAVGGDVAGETEDILEVRVDVLVGAGTQLVKDAADFDAIVGVGIRATRGRDQGALLVLLGVTLLIPR